MKILIAGDFVISKSYPVELVDTEIIELFKQSDFNIVNLEAPITKNNSKIFKTGPHLTSNEESTKTVLQTLNIHLVTLANNHILDYGEQGVLDTLYFCKKNKIQTVGAGKNLVEASQTMYLDTQEGRIAIVNFAENEWSSATMKTAGANPVDIVDNTNQIIEAKSKADYVIVIVHGGHEYYNLPNPRMQKEYRFYVDNGADLVIGHHPHCISGKETYNAKDIYYSLGNFLFTMPSIHEDWYNGGLLELKISNYTIKTKIHFVKQEKNNYKLCIDNQNKALKHKFEAYSSIIEDKDKLLDKWNSFVESKKKMMDFYWSPINMIGNRYLKAVFFRLNLWSSNKKMLSLYCNLVRCESLRELSLSYFKKKIKTI